jgi:hypothetical protein
MRVTAMAQATDDGCGQRRLRLAAPIPDPGLAGIDDEVSLSCQGSVPCRESR